MTAEVGQAMTARIDGTAASLDAAVRSAASVLSEARQPLITGLGTDIAGVTAAISLAGRLRGVADHAGSAATLRDLDVMRRSGWIVTTPPEARARADVVVLAGPGLDDEREDLRLVLDAAGPHFPEGGTRRVFRLSADDGSARLVAAAGLIRMKLAGRAPSMDPSSQEIAEALRSARYGVIIWSGAHLTEAAVEMLCGLIEALNAKTRCAGLPLSGGDNAAGAAQAAAWLTGYPFPVAFGRGFPEHDPLRFDTVRMAESGEGDAALWIMSLGTSPPPWKRDLPLVALVSAEADGADWLGRARVAITVGRPGIEHDAVLHDARVGGLVARQAGSPGSLPSVSDVIGLMMAALPGC